jgi:hypothetical protein
MLKIQDKSILNGESVANLHQLVKNVILPCAKKQNIYNFNRVLRLNDYYGFNPWPHS